MLQSPSLNVQSRGGEICFLSWVMGSTRARIRIYCTVALCTDADLQRDSLDDFGAAYIWAECVGAKRFYSPGQVIGYDKILIWIALRRSILIFIAIDQGGLIAL